MRCEQALVTALADPSTYGGTDVVVRQTHASWVFLAGDRAFKLKKPIALGFLDYTTPARRHCACLEEVRINQELAPGVYLGVRAVVRTEAGFALAHERAPDAVDYVVEMQRFREADTLAGLIASDRLTAAHLDAVAGRLAAFHRLAPAVGGGGAGEVLEMWQRNVRELAEVGPNLGSTVDLAENFAEAFVCVHGEEIERRRRAGLVRDGHGDLRCDHVLVQPAVRIVDRIEFDPSLRHSDIACDLAFLTMDLEGRGQRWAAEELVRAYRREAMDAGSDTLLGFYAAHHALVRAKVALITTAEHEPEHDDEHACEPGEAPVQEARPMLALAERLCWRARAPLAIVICGAPATGKSTLAAELSRRSELPVVSSDAIRKAAAGIAATERATAEYYSRGFTHHTYKLLARRAEVLLARGSAVIVDASCWSRSERSTLLGRLRHTGVPRLVVHCQVPLEVALERAARRVGDPERVSDADPLVAARQYRSFQPLEELPPDSVIELDTRLALDVQVGEVTRAIDRRLAACAGGGRG